ncbi:CcoQ/FixQ family Cbb3-type cytochrome c oxidase assembly chaperone [Neisseria sp. ZJ106]|uniref:CcoQ/FixQ family Cbb3-type cytochrome c oxidase assembly chaperone n=1 Tax=Neisseria lisongii TaxID=2912188 RepID=A0AAW5AKI7_9NEIS|nr:CcoQ/FixQ family Cbb3-type cytochrome c oxidase assembly chaperone [Neisseria lisongii]MCF7521767.1 CcoQ/FixQ family Cbb3-type cytochrome c oxidase assembly chaperone [Neisseria lisongii]MCF7530422.1 CcoQ/FixQ family Cbb3-type cytochrome c oxidase assembly chaperone [Neisseria lisongii]WCL70996.1 CcoQ/FixQ family Cbb3-type cytochrome c oxidase assembly chaperone [Neisseria lisongii]
MDVNWIRSLFTLWVFLCFMLVIYIVFHRRNKQNYDEAASSIFDEDSSDKNGR